VAGNPFYIQPASVDTRPVLQGIGSLVKSSRDAQKKKALTSGLQGAYSSNDPDKVAEFVAENPESTGALNEMMNFRNEATKKNYGEFVRGFLTNPTRENFVEMAEARSKFVRDQGGDSSGIDQAVEAYDENPEAAVNRTELSLAAISSPQEWKAYQQQKGIGGDASRQEALQIKRDTLDLRRLEASLRSEENELKREKIRLDIDAKKEKLKTNKESLNKKARDTIKQQGSLSSAIDNFIGNKDYVNSVTGWRGRLPAITDSGLEAEAFFDNIKNNLTLENLDKMTGVLSETDIKILSTAATSLQKGMSRKAMIGEMNKIKEVLKEKSSSTQKLLLGLGDDQGEPLLTPEQQAELDRLRAIKAAQDGR